MQSQSEPEQTDKTLYPGTSEFKVPVGALAQPSYNPQPWLQPPTCTGSEEDKNAPLTPVAAAKGKIPSRPVMDTSKVQREQCISLCEPSPHPRESGLVVNRWLDLEAPVALGAAQTLIWERGVGGPAVGQAQAEGAGSQQQIWGDSRCQAYWGGGEINWAIASAPATGYWRGGGLCHWQRLGGQLPHSSPQILELEALQQPCPPAVQGRSHWRGPRGHPR